MANIFFRDEIISNLLDSDKKEYVICVKVKDCFPNMWKDWLNTVMVTYWYEGWSLALEMTNSFVTWNINAVDYNNIIEQYVVLLLSLGSSLCMIIPLVRLLNCKTIFESWKISRLSSNLPKLQSFDQSLYLCYQYSVSILCQLLIYMSFC